MRAKRLLEKMSISEGSTSYEDISKMRPIPANEIIDGTLKDGTKFRLGIIKERNFGGEYYSYAYITLNKSKYCKSVFSGGEAGGGISTFEPFTPGAKYGSSEFVKFV